MIKFIYFKEDTNYTMTRQLNLLTATILFSIILIATACTGKASTPALTTQPATATRTAGIGAPVGPFAPNQEIALEIEAVALAYNPADGSLLKADSQGLSRWQGGSSWTKIDILGETSLSGVVINPTAPDNIYIAGPGLGVARADNSGESWQTINSGLPNLDITALAMHSYLRDTLYAWVNNDGIYRTEDGGASWKKTPDLPIQDPNVRGLVHSTLEGSMNTGWLYAATPSGAFLSMD
jgi:hypothetical protein